MWLSRQLQALKIVCAAPIPAAFLALALGQSIVVVTLQSIIVHRWLDWLRPNAFQVATSDTVPTNLFLLIFSLLFELLYVYDAILSRSTVQVALSCLLNAGLVLFAVYQYHQIGKSVIIISGSRDSNLDPLVNLDFDFWTVSSRLMLAIAVVLGLFSLVFPIAAWYLRNYFSWQSYRNVSPDARLRRSRIVRQAHIMLVKLDIYFTICFFAVYIILVRVRGTELILLIVGAVLALAIIIQSVWSSKTEKRIGMILAIVTYLSLAAFIIYKLVIVYAPSPDHFQYVSAIELLVGYGTMALFCYTLTLVSAVLCILDFGSGIKPFLKDYEGAWQSQPAAMESLRSIPFQNAHYMEYSRSMERNLDS